MTDYDICPDCGRTIFNDDNFCGYCENEYDDLERKYEEEIYK